MAAPLIEGLDSRVAGCRRREFLLSPPHDLLKLRARAPLHRAREKHREMEISPVKETGLLKKEKKKPK